MFQKRLQFFRSVLYAGDLALVAVCWLLSYYVRFFLPIIPVTKGTPPIQQYVILLFLVLTVFAVTLPVMGLYRRPWARLAQAWWPILRAVTLGAVVAIALTYFLRAYELSRLVFAQFFILLTVTMIVSRPFWHRVWTRRRKSDPGEGVIIVGVEELGRTVAQMIRSHPELGLRLVGFLTRRPELVGQTVDELPVMGLYQEIPEVLARNPVQVVIIALPLAAHDRIYDVINNVADEMVDIKIVPDLYRFMRFKNSIEEFEGMPIIGLRGSPLEGWARVAKRAMDLAGSLVAIILLGPVMLAVTLGVKLSSPGPVLYRQKRMGMDGRVFDMLKFRSMARDAERDCGPVWACPEDPRRTRFGSFIRKTSLDELPQLFNVLRGDMSLVGPRPERPEFITEFRHQIPGYMLRHKTKAGMTGWAQINGWRGNTSLERRIEHDLYYIENWSLWFDLKIVLITLVRGWVSPHAY
ncbi:MAG: undecaprenyl-phosphate glucose phosphotransferase [Deltaproteobacteria bacterium]|nr:undecaprenyl-phosphate glucose phosphotransferase [Deltaproteobacteria bacterium]